MRNPHHYLVPQQRIPGYLPYPNPVAPGPIPVANASSVNWPQAQFAEPFVPAGTPSVSPYRYPDYSKDLHLAGLALDNGRAQRKARRSSRKRCREARRALRSYRGGLRSFYLDHGAWKDSKNTAAGKRLAANVKSACGRGGGYGDPMFDGEAALPNPDVMGFIQENKKIILGVALAAVLVKTGALDKILARF